MEARLVAAVAAGGAVGAVLRYTVGAALGRTGLPYATLVVNVVGSFLLALLVFAQFDGRALSPALRAFTAVGVLGAFTTMSALSYETVALWLDGRAGPAALNVVLNVALSLLAVFVGRAAALALAAPRPA